MRKRITSCLLALALAALCCAPVALALTAANFTKTAEPDTDIVFTADDFNAVIEGESFDKITITVLPAEADGALMLDETPVTENQELDATAVGTLKFVPESGFAAVATFKFFATVGEDESDEATVSLDYTEHEPPALLPPVASDGTLKVTQQTSQSGTLAATDPQSLPLTYSIVTQPTKGTVELVDAETGAFVYNPTGYKLGADSFTFKASNGAEDSNIATVNIEIELPEITPLAYADLKTHWSHTSAGSLATLGMVVGEKYHNTYYFFPERFVTRGEFLIMLNAVLPFEPTDEASGFQDVKAFMTDIVNAAKKAGVVEGVMLNGKSYLRPDNVITRLEAIKMLSDAMNFQAQNTDELTFDDADTLPSWSLPAVKNLVGYKIIQGSSGLLRPNELMSRGMVAEILFKAWREKLVQLSLA